MTLACRPLLLVVSEKCVERGKDSATTLDFGKDRRPEGRRGADGEGQPGATAGDSAEGDSGAMVKEDYLAKARVAVTGAVW
jgi:hypothetical protein